jgi:hypothetical protein
MLNKLKTGQNTVKDNLLKVTNANFHAILEQKVLEDAVSLTLSRPSSLRRP